MTLRPLFLAPLLASVLATGHAATSRPSGVSGFAPEGSIEFPRDAIPPPPVFRGRKAPRAISAPARRTRSGLSAHPRRLADLNPAPILADTYIQDGSGPVVTVNPVQQTNVVV